MDVLKGIEVTEDMSTFPNMYYSPDLEDTFIYLIARITLWYNLMVEKFNSANYAASSGGSESAFKTIKHDYGIGTLFLINKRINY